MTEIREKPLRILRPLQAGLVQEPGGEGRPSGCSSPGAAVPRVEPSSGEASVGQSHHDGVEVGAAAPELGGDVRARVGAPG